MLVATTYSGFANLPKQYSQLFGDACHQSVFLSLPWFRNLERTVLDPDEFVRIIGVEKSGPAQAPVGALVLKSNRRRNRLITQHTVESLATYYTAYFAPVITETCENTAEITGLFARELAARQPPLDVLNIRPVDFSKASVNGLYRALNEVGLRTQKYFCFGNWYLKVARRSYAEYFKDLPNIIRKNVPYYQRRLRKSARLKFKLYTKTDDLETAIRDYETVYNASWRESEPYPSFISGLVKLAAEQGWLRMGVFYIDDEPAAAQLWIVVGSVASIYKICYAEKFGKWSVGSVLTAQMLEHALDVDRVDEVDYLSGDDSYKADWMSDRRERWGIMAFNPRTVWGAAGILRHIVGRSLKARSRSFVKGVSNQFHCLKVPD